MNGSTKRRGEVAAVAGTHAEGVVLSAGVEKALRRRARAGGFRSTASVRRGRTVEQIDHVVEGLFEQWGIGVDQSLSLSFTGVKVA
jgi:hypothetical protein